MTRIPSLHQKDLPPLALQTAFPCINVDAHLVQHDTAQHCCVLTTSPRSIPGDMLSDGNAIWPRVIDNAAVRLIVGGSQHLGKARNIMYTDLLTGKASLIIPHTCTLHCGRMHSSFPTRAISIAAASIHLSPRVHSSLGPRALIIPPACTLHWGFVHSALRL